MAPRWLPVCPTGRIGHMAISLHKLSQNGHFVSRFPSSVAAILKHHLWSYWNSSWPWFRSSVRNPVGPRVLYPLTLNSCNQPIFADNEFMRQSISTILHFENSKYYGTNNCWFPLARKWPTWKWTWIWIVYGKIEKKCPRYFRRDSRGNPRDLNMCRTGRSAALSRGRKSMPPRRESMKLVVQQRKFT